MTQLLSYKHALKEALKIHPLKDRQKLKKDKHFLETSTKEHLSKNFEKSVIEEFDEFEACYQKELNSWMDYLCVQKKNDLNKSKDEFYDDYKAKCERNYQRDLIETKRENELHEIEKKCDDLHHKWLGVVIKNQLDRLDTISKEFNHQAEVLRHLFVYNTQIAQNSHKALDEDFSRKTSEIELRREKLSEESKEMVQMQLEIISKKQTEKRSSVEVKTKSLIQHLQNRYETDLNKMQKETQDTILEHHKLIENDQSLTRKLEELNRKIETAKLSINRWKDRSKWLKKFYSERNKKLETECNILIKDYKTIQSKIRESRKSEKVKLGFLATKTHYIKEYLNNNKELALKVIRKAERCKKFQTSMEQLRFYNSPFKASEKGQILNQELSLNLKKSLSFEADVFDHFFDGYNKALIEIYALRNAKDSISKQNSLLEKYLKHCEKGLGIINQDFKTENPLLIINERNSVTPDFELKFKTFTTANKNQVEGVIQIRSNSKAFANLQFPSYEKKLFSSSLLF